MEYTIEQLRQDLQDNMAPVRITDGDKEYKIRNLLLMDENRRDRVLMILDRIKGSEDEEKTTAEALRDAEKAMDDFLREAVDDGKGHELVRLLDNLALKRKVVQDWAESSNAGKA